MAERKLDPELLGRRLRALRGNRSIAEVGRLSGVPDHTVARYEKGEIDKPAFEDMVNLGKFVFHLTPTHMAALAELYPAPEADSENFEPEIANVLSRLRVYLQNADRAERQRMATLVDGMIEVAEFNRKALPVATGDEEPQLPSWLNRILRSGGDEEQPRPVSTSTTTPMMA